MQNNFVYLDIDDAYIHSLISFIQEEGFVEPPYFSQPCTAGAHISVMYPEEMLKYGIKRISECDQSMCFTLKSCKVVRPLSWKEVDEAYVIIVDAPALDALRKKYGMPKPANPFHITIGVKPKKTEINGG